MKQNTLQHQFWGIRPSIHSVQFSRLSQIPNTTQLISPSRSNMYSMFLDYTYIYICICTCIYVFMYSFFHVLTYLCIDVLMYACMYVFMYVCLVSFWYVSYTPVILIQLINIKWLSGRNSQFLMNSWVFGSSPIDILRVGYQPSGWQPINIGWFPVLAKPRPLVGWEYMFCIYIYTYKYICIHSMVHIDIKQTSSQP